MFLVFTKTSLDDDARAVGPGYYFSIFGKLQKCEKKKIYRVIGPMLTAFLQFFVYCQNMDILTLLVDILKSCVIFCHHSWLL